MIMIIKMIMLIKAVTQSIFKLAPPNFAWMYNPDNLRDNDDSIDDDNDI